MQINSSLIKENAALRRAAREQLKGNWGMFILLCVTFSIISGIPGAIPYVGVVLSLLISGPLALGIISVFMKLIRKESYKFEDLFDGFKNYVSALLLTLLTAIFTILWSLLFIIPGIIATYRYAMAFYILNDYPEISAMDAINISKELMKGYKWKLFCLHFSFIGWALLCIITFGIGFLWLIPYQYAAIANFYQNLKEASDINTLVTSITSSTQANL